MRWLFFIVGFCSSTAFASPWGLELGLVGGMGIARFAGEPTASPPPTDPTNLFAIYPPSAKGSQDTGLAGSVGVSITFTRKRKLYASLELLSSGQNLKFDEDLTFPSGTERKRSTVWEWNGFRPTLIAAYAWPLKLGDDWGLAPRLGGGAWYEKVTSRFKEVSVDSGPAKELAWNGAPEDDWGWIAVVGLDWLRLGKGHGPARIGLDVRWREGHALPQPSAGADKPVRVIDAVLTVPVWLWVL